MQNIAFIHDQLFQLSDNVRYYRYWQFGVHVVAEKQTKKHSDINLPGKFDLR